MPEGRAACCFVYTAWLRTLLEERWIANPVRWLSVVMFANSEKGLEVAKPIVDEAMGEESLAFEWLK